MFRARTSDDAAKLAALDRVQGVIEFDLDGTIRAANPAFLGAVGYRADEVVGRHHAMFMAPEERDSDVYRAFWERLRGGAFEAAQYRRIAKGGREIWIQASYNPILDRAGRPVKVVKFATDITAQKAEDADRAGQIAAITTSQAVISFDLDGTILDANPNFLGVVGYRLDEVVGRHHGMFVDAGERESDAYGAFWAALRRGTYQAAQYRRIAKGGREVWIQASYNPILDAAGRPYKVVKFATDITEQVRLLAELRGLIERNFGAIDAAVARSRHASGAAGDAAGAASASVQAMAAAAEELAASVSEVSQSMAKSKAATDAAVGQVEAVDDRTRRLSEAAVAMTGIVGLIQSIAGQINLLALNATIEAARAGAAGRGFAVVAAEVKALAAQAAGATDRINAEIGAVQGISGEVVSALSAIRAAVQVMREHVVTTAGAVEEQDAVTRELSRSMQEAAASVSGISGNIGAISDAVAEVTEAVGTTRAAAQVLAR
ncbi:PAS domain-containing methyl-accepting chemotaxis protein [Methylobacterium sp. NEAU 140]|uniref:methyl-accepting chemotaxis protein n=1 Tax=Methylobacterium sp. NEAU 140 TaxID=3064945 RepID=UPI00273327EC|nr:PAS domain-containing methyl-accepting chemotaxis protein [Methylobacterium sp. NEAU 140]MDP4024270.1 PAS domain-containing methyl-accepting chemotaxis protein [Methylobacterium sp. NEAU 140]